MILNKREFLKLKAKELNNNLPKSEVWFWEQWDKLGMLCDKERRNKPFAGFIPDVICRDYRYIIEIDGSYHDRPDQIKRDEEKNKVFNSFGYRVFRLKPYNEKELLSLSVEIKAIRELGSKRKVRRTAESIQKRKDRFRPKKKPKKSKKAPKLLNLDFHKRSQAFAGTPRKRSDTGRHVDGWSNRKRFAFGRFA